MPASPQAVALYLGRLAADVKAMATIEQARAPISHLHAAADMQKNDNPAWHLSFRHRPELPRGYSATLTHDGRVRNADPNNPTRSRWLETALFTAMAVNPHSP